MDTFESERGTNLMEYWPNLYELEYVKNKIRSIGQIEFIVFIEFIVHKRIVCEPGVFKPIVEWSSEGCCYRIAYIMKLWKQFYFYNDWL